MIGDAIRYLHKVAGPFDLIFQDGDTSQYSAAARRSSSTARAGGLLVTAASPRRATTISARRRRPTHHDLSVSMEELALSVKRSDLYDDRTMARGRQVRRLSPQSCRSWPTCSRGWRARRPRCAPRTGTTMRGARYAVATKPPRTRSHVAMTGCTTITSLAPRVARGELRAERLTEDALGDHREAAAALNAFITVTADEALADARQADREIAGGRYRGPLHGIPISLKDLIDVAGVPTTAASRLREGTTGAARCAGRQRTCARRRGVRRQDQPARVRVRHDQRRLGLGPGAPSDRSDRDRPAGRAAARPSPCAPACRIASVGTDTGGSIRIPAAACGIVGLKPGWGEISADGVVPLSRQLDHVGPLARSVDDAASDVRRAARRAVPRRSSRSIARASPGSSSRRLTATSWIASAPRSKPGFRQPSRRLRRGGASCRRHRSPHAARHRADLSAPRAGRCRGVSRHERSSAGRTPTRPTCACGSRWAATSSPRTTCARCAAATVIRQRGRARARRASMRSCCRRCRSRRRRSAPPRVPVKGGQEPVRTAMLRCTQPFNLTGHPAISLPCGTTRAGLPVGLQIVGHHGRTADLLRVARAVEQTLSRTRCSRRSFTAGSSVSPTSAATERVVRPFDWGLDWMPANGHRRRTRSPQRCVRAWIDAVMQDTDAFFTPAPTDRLHVHTGVATAATTGTLTFPSALDDAASRRTTSCTRASFPRRDKRRAVVVLPQWNSDAGGHIGLSRLLARVGITALRLSLPYHDRPHAAGAHARRLHRQLQRRAHRAGVPAGGARCAARAVVAARPGLRASRPARHEPRLVPGDADRGARAAGARAGAQSRLAVFRGRRLAGPVDVARARRASTATSSSRRCANCGGRSARGRISNARAARRRCSCTRSTT